MKLINNHFSPSNDTRSMEEYISFIKKCENTRKMTDETNYNNIKNLKEVLPYFYLDYNSYQTVLHCIDNPPIHPLWTRRLNNQNRLVIPCEPSEETDLGYKALLNLLYTTDIFSALSSEQWTAITSFQTWQSGKMPNGMKLFKYLKKLGYTDSQLNEITTIRNTDKTYIVLSKNPIDLVFMSTNQSYSSCMSLDSCHDEAFYYGLPHYLADPHTFVVFLTNGKLKSYDIKRKTFKHFRMLNRSLAILTSRGTLGLVRYYPHQSISYVDPLLKAGILVEDRGRTDKTVMWESNTWPIIKKLYLEDHSDCCPYFDCRASFRYTEHGPQYSNMGTSGSTMNLHWEDGFNSADSIEDIAGARWLCDECNYTIRNSDEVYTHDEYTFCESCYNDLIERCYDCDRTDYRENMYYIEALNGYVCNHCRPENYTICEMCDCLVHVEDIQYAEAEDKNICTDCGEVRHCKMCDTSTFEDNLNNNDICDRCQYVINEQIEELQEQLEELKEECDQKYNEIKELEEKLNG